MFPEKKNLNEFRLRMSYQVAGKDHFVQMDYCAGNFSTLLVIMGYFCFSKILFIFIAKTFYALILRKISMFDRSTHH